MRTHFCDSGVIGHTGVFRCCEGQDTFVHFNWDASSEGSAGWPSNALMSPAQAFEAIAAHVTDHDQSQDVQDLVAAETMLTGFLDIRRGIAALHKRLPAMQYLPRPERDGDGEPD